MNQEHPMTIPMSIPFAGRRLVFSMNLFVAPAKSASPSYPEAVDATDADLARLNRRAEADADRRRWQAQAIFHGVRS
jgi:hypothetical protein